MRPFDHIRRRPPAGLSRARVRKRRKHPTRAVARYQRMRSFGVGRYRYLAAVPLLLVLIAVVAWIKLPPLESARYRPVRYELNSPLMGWAVPATIEPGTAGVAHTLVHATLTWRELEKTEGVFDFAAFEEKNHFAEWRARGVRTILRFVLDEPGAQLHMDVPDWLLPRMDEPGTFYEASFGAGFSPNYANWDLQLAHGAVLSAIGARYNDDPFIAFVEMGSLGHGGEWWVDDSVPPLPLLLQVRTYFSAYSAAFPDTALLAVNPYQSAKLLQAGLYNPFLGDLDRTWDWLDMANYGGYEPQLGTDLRGMGEFYKFAPSGAQISRRASAEGLLLQSPERLLEQIRECRATYISGAPATDLSDELQSNLRIAAEAMGYRYWVRSAQWQRSARRGESVPMSLYIRNSGVAPMCQSWPVRIVMMDEDGAEVAGRVANIDVRKVLPGESRFNESIDVPIDLAPGEYALGIQIVDPVTGEAGVELAMVTERFGLTSILGWIEVG